MGPNSLMVVYVDPLGYELPARSNYFSPAQLGPKVTINKPIRARMSPLNPKRLNPILAVWGLGFRVARVWGCYGSKGNHVVAVMSHKTFLPVGLHVYR